MRRLMQTIIALPSRAATRSSKCLTRFGADECFNARPFPLEAILLGLSLILGKFGDLSVDLWFLVLVEFDPRQTALVVDRHGCTVLDSASDIVDVDVVAEHSRGIDVLFLYRRPSEADK